MYLKNWHVCIIKLLRGSSDIRILSMTVLFQSHGGREKEKVGAALAAPPAGTDIAVDEQADFGYFFPPLDAPEDYLPNSGEVIGHLDELGALMADTTTFAESATANSTMPPVLTYWGQFLDHELTARTDRESSDHKYKRGTSAAVIFRCREHSLETHGHRALISTAFMAAFQPETDCRCRRRNRDFRHAPSHTPQTQMRVGTAIEDGPTPPRIPTTLRPSTLFSGSRFGQASPAIRLAQASMAPEDFA